MPVTRSQTRKNVEMFKQLTDFSSCEARLTTVSYGWSEIVREYARLAIEQAFPLIDYNIYHSEIIRRWYEAIYPPTSGKTKYCPGDIARVKDPYEVMAHYYSLVLQME